VGDLVNKKELDCLSSTFPKLFRRNFQDLTLFMSGANEVRSSYGNYQKKGDVSQYISYGEYRRMGGTIGRIHDAAGIPVRILTYDYVNE
jgi:hypothetical protein